MISMIDIKGKIKFEMILDKMSHPMDLVFRLSMGEKGRKLPLLPIAYNL